MRHFFLFFCLILCSCEHSGLDGDCTPLELSKRELSFNAKGGADSVIIKSSFWWLIDEVTECEYIGAWEPDYCNNNYCRQNSEIMKVKCSWFNVMRIDEYKLLVSVDKNETGEERKQYVYVQGGDCFSSFLVNQSAE